MIWNDIQSIVESLTIDGESVKFYSGTTKTTNKLINSENSYFVFLERPIKFDTEKNTAGLYNKKNKLVLAFLKHTNFDKTQEYKDVIITKLFDGFIAFIKEATKRGFKIEGISGSDLIDFSWFNNNTSGWYFELTLIDKNKFNDCY